MTRFIFHELVVVCLSLNLLSPQFCLAETTQAELAPLKLDQAVDTALDKNDQVKNGILEISISKDRVLSSRTDFLPKAKVSVLGVQLLTPLNFSFNQGAFGSFPLIGPVPGENLDVTTPARPLLFVNVAVTQPILQLGRIALAVKENQLSKAIASQKLRVQQSQVANQVKKAYYRALELQENVSVAEATVKLYQEIERTTNEYLAHQTVLKADAIEVEQQLADAEYQTTKAKDDLATQKEEINRMLGRDPEMDFMLVMVGDSQAMNMDLAGAQAHALSTRGELRQADYQAQQLAIEARIKRLQYLPDLSFVFDYLSMFGTQVIPSNVAAVGLFLNWEPFDWGKKHWEGAEKKKQLLQVKNNMHELTTQITVEVNSTYRKLQEAQQYMHVSELGRQLALERLRVVANKYTEKAALLKDVLKAQKDVTQANNQYDQSALSLWTARADFEKAMGND